MQIQKRLIAIDGLDASGKKTQTALLTTWLETQGLDYRLVSFPTYDTEYSALVKMYLSGRFGDDPEVVNPYAASSFFAMDRYSSYLLDWKKDYDSGRIIVADRYTSANAVHQLSKLQPAQYAEFLDWLSDFEYTKLGLPRPDGVMYLALPPALSRQLIASRSKETGVAPDIHELSETHSQRSYEAALFSAIHLNWHKIDCGTIEGGIRTRESVHEEVVRVASEVLGL